jgi:hypothetical protein
MPYRVAAGVLEHLLPIDAGIDPETLRQRVARIHKIVTEEIQPKQHVTLRMIVRRSLV